jgi:transposase-like protein
MAQLYYRRHRLPPEIIQHPIWRYPRFALSYRDVEDLLAERGLHISYETCGAECGNRWHLDEMVVPIAGDQMCSGR